jgi:HAMP domain-containing protein/putative methionine-R-sulfoxide reductase with GAF domain
MNRSIRGRITLVFIGMAVVPLLVIGVSLAWLIDASLREPAPGGMAAPEVNLAVVILILAGLMTVIAGGLGFLFARRLIEPIQTLTEAAGAISAGDLTARPLTPSNDEIGILAGTFNGMARQLRDRIGTLEHRVADRARALAAFREVSRLSAQPDEKQLAAEVVQLVKNTFHYYHAQIFLYDPARENLIPFGGKGDMGRLPAADEKNIPAGKGPVENAAETNSPVLIGDVSQYPGWLPDPLLPKTKSEAAVPIALGDLVLGVLDVQQNITHGITPADMDLLQTIANQVAVALRNPGPAAPARTTDEGQARIASIGRKIRETTTVENALRVAESELSRALGSRKIRVVLSASPQAAPAEMESQPGGENK